MQTWNFKVQNNPLETGKQLQASLASINGLVFSMNTTKNNAITFKIRKRILYAWYLIYQNYIIVDGKLSESGTEGETNVEVSFTKHFLMRLIIFTHIFLGLGFLLVIISGVSSNASMYIIGGILLAIGLFIWYDERKRTNKKIQEFKTLISGIMTF